MKTLMKPIGGALLGAVLLAAAHAHGPGGHARGHGSGAVVLEQKPWGIAGDPARVSRTIRITMTDDMRFSPSKLTIQRGEVIRFEVVNAGKILHEMVIGTRQELDAHAALMLKHPDMEHDEPYMAHVEAGQSTPIVWHFNRAGKFHFACLIPGHFQAGMTGDIEVLR